MWLTMSNMVVMDMKIAWEIVVWQCVLHDV